MSIEIAVLQVELEPSSKQGLGFAFSLKCLDSTHHFREGALSDSFVNGEIGTDFLFGCILVVTLGLTAAAHCQYVGIYHFLIQ